MYPESDEHLVEIGDDKQFLIPALHIPAGQVLGQVDHCDNGIPGLEDPFHRRMGMGHGMHLFRHHDLPDFGHIDSIQIPVNGKLHDLDLIGSRFQQDSVFFLFHDIDPPLPYQYNFKLQF